MFGALDVSKFLGFIEYLTQFGKPASVRDLSLIVEHLARIAQASNMNARLVEILGAPR